MHCTYGQTSGRTPSTICLREKNLVLCIYCSKAMRRFERKLFKTIALARWGKRGRNNCGTTFQCTCYASTWNAQTIVVTVVIVVDDVVFKLPGVKTIVRFLLCSTQALTHSLLLRSLWLTTYVKSTRYVYDVHFTIVFWIFCVCVPGPSIIIFAVVVIVFLCRPLFHQCNNVSLDDNVRPNFIQTIDAGVCIAFSIFVFLDVNICVAWDEKHLRLDSISIFIYLFVNWCCNTLPHVRRMMGANEMHKHAPQIRWSEWEVR